MCSRVQCRTCGRPTFSGCGNHIEQVLGDVDPADRCPGHISERGGARGSLLDRLLGR